METKDLKDLVDVFKDYRDLLLPVQSGLADFIDSYDGLKINLEKVNELFDGDINGKLDKIYSTLYLQSQKSTDLSSRIDLFLKNTSKYADGISHITVEMENVQESLEKIKELESKAEEQIKKLDSIIQDKKINYNLKDLQKLLENYNSNVQKVSDFINKDVADQLKSNNEKIQEIKNENIEIKNMLENQSKDIETLIGYFKTTSELLKNSVIKEDVNEEYIFTILDKWALNRKVKTTKSGKKEWKKN